MNEVQTFSLPPALYTPLMLYADQLEPFKINPQFLLSDQLETTEMSFRSSIRDRLKFLQSKMSWLLSGLSMNCIEDENTVETMSIVSLMISLRNEIVLVTKLVRTLEYLKKKTSKSRSSGSFAGQTSKELSLKPLKFASVRVGDNGIKALIKEYASKHDTDASFGRAVLLILEGRPPGFVWSLLSTRYTKSRREDTEEPSIEQARLYGLMLKWIKSDRVILGNNLLRRIMHFFDEHHLNKPDVSSKIAKILPFFITKNITLYKLGNGVSVHNIAFQYPPANVAEQLTIIARRYYMRLKSYTLVSKMWEKEDCQCIAEPITSFISHLNTVSNWVTTTLLSSQNKKATLKLLLKITANLYELENLSTLSAVFSVLSSANLSAIVDRILLTMSKRSNDAYKFLEAQLNPVHNFATLRKIQEVSTLSTAIPFLPTLLSDLVVMAEFPETEGEAINIRKYQTIADVLANFFKFTRRNPKIQEIPPLLSFLEALPCLTDSLLSSDTTQQWLHDISAPKNLD
eukprot:TRINITY_DN7547_c0_g2_i1.p1 TRINITY_DN7547_c0_g2~~TRINITY_DN7547_c0_g2_i1.p1  ORF type:complete len:550 (+),score=56.01 TRINITY_DN7547_c0_g2_i1:108-1652(+)